MVTKAKNNKKFTFKNPATKVSGSPMIGTHANNKDQTPNLLNLLEAVFILFFSKGNHLLLIYLNK